MKKRRERILSIKCRTPFCSFDKVPGRSGLCASCYEIVMDLCRQGLITRQQLEAAGMVEPKELTKKSYFLTAAVGSKAPI